MRSIAEFVATCWYPAHYVCARYDMCFSRNQPETVEAGGSFVDGIFGLAVCLFWLCLPSPLRWYTHPTRCGVGRLPFKGNAHAYVRINFFHPERKYHGQHRHVGGEKMIRVVSARVSPLFFCAPLLSEKHSCWSFPEIRGLWHRLFDVGCVILLYMVAC